jgi:hypothetical protein
MPLKPSRKLEGFFVFVILTKEESKKLIKYKVRIRTEVSVDASLRDTEMYLFFFLGKIR